MNSEASRHSASALDENMRAATSQIAEDERIKTLREAFGIQTIQVYKAQQDGQIAIKLVARENTSKEVILCIEESNTAQEIVNTVRARLQSITMLPTIEGTNRLDVAIPNFSFFARTTNRETKQKYTDAELMTMATISYQGGEDLIHRATVWLTSYDTNEAEEIGFEGFRKRKSDQEIIQNLVKEHRIEAYWMRVRTDGKTELHIVYAHPINQRYNYPEEEHVDCFVLCECLRRGAREHGLEGKLRFLYRKDENTGEVIAEGTIDNPEDDESNVLPDPEVEHSFTPPLPSITTSRNGVLIAEEYKLSELFEEIRKYQEERQRRGCHLEMDLIVGSYDLKDDKDENEDEESDDWRDDETWNDSDTDQGGNIRKVWKVSLHERFPALTPIDRTSEVDVDPQSSLHTIDQYVKDDLLKYLKDQFPDVKNITASNEEQKDAYYSEVMRIQWVADEKKILQQSLSDLLDEMRSQYINRNPFDHSTVCNIRVVSHSDLSVNNISMGLEFTFTKYDQE